jgi:hypothetical protein
MLNPESQQGVLNPIKYVAELAPAEVKARNKVGVHYKPYKPKTCTQNLEP